MRKAFGCGRDATRYPYATSSEWTSLIIRREWVEESPNDKAKVKEYDKYFKQMIGNFEKTIAHVLKKYSGNPQYSGLVEQFELLNNRLSQATTMADLIVIIDIALEEYDKQGIKKMS